jgi:hypothetical protein
VKKILVLSATSLLLIAISGCSSMNGQAKPQSSITTTMQKIVTEENEDSTTKNSPYSKTSTVYKTEGTYIGKIDNSSVEIKVDGKVRVFVLSKGISDYEGGSILKFSYYEDENGQDVISEVLHSSFGQ